MMEKLNASALPTGSDMAMIAMRFRQTTTDGTSGL